MRLFMYLICLFAVVLIPIYLVDGIVWSAWHINDQAPVYMFYVSFCWGVLWGSVFLKFLLQQGVLNSNEAHA